MNRSFFAGVTATLTVASLAALGAPPALAQSSDTGKKHESNTLRKAGKTISHNAREAGKAISHNAREAGKATGHNARVGGKAIEYGVRKGGENVSVSAHRATG